MAHISDIFGDERLSPLSVEALKKLAEKCAKASTSGIKARVIELPEPKIRNNEIKKIEPPKTRGQRLRAWLDEKI